MAAVTIQENKICHCFWLFPINLPWSDGTDTMRLWLSLPVPCTVIFLSPWTKMWFLCISKEQVSFNFVASVTVCSNFEAQENIVYHCFHFFPIYLPWSTVDPLYLQVCIHGFNQIWSKTLKKEFQKVLKSQTWICHASATIYIAFALY